MLIWKYICCFCYSDKRKKLRKQQQAKKAFDAAVEKKLQQDVMDTQYKAATKIQSIIRAFLARSRCRTLLEEAIRIANDYWMAELMMTQIELERKRRAKEITKNVRD